MGVDKDSPPRSIRYSGDSRGARQGTPNSFHSSGCLRPARRPVPSTSPRPVGGVIGDGARFGEDGRDQQIFRPGYQLYIERCTDLVYVRARPTSPMWFFQRRRASDARREWKIFLSSTSQHARSCVRVSRPPIHSCDDVIGCAKRSDTPSTITDRGEGGGRPVCPWQPSILKP